MQTAIYSPTGRQAMVMGEIDDSNLLIFTDNKQMIVSRDDVVFHSDEIIGFDAFRQILFSKLLNGSYADIFYSLHSGRLTPEPHQYKPLLKFIHSPNNRLLIADEVGLGKTIEAGMIYAELSKREHLAVSIVVAPPSLLHKWRDELLFRFGEEFEIFDSKKFISFLRDYSLHYDNKSFDEKIIISYNTLRNEPVIKRLDGSPLIVDFLVMDEAHTFRNDPTSTRKSVEKLTEKAKSILFLSATPVQNKIEDLFNILSLLDSEYFQDSDSFKKAIAPNAILHKLVAMLKNHHTLKDIQEHIAGSEYKNVASHAQQEIIEKLFVLGELTKEGRVLLSDELTASDHLSFIINRTKKKDVGKLIPRKATSKSISLTVAEKAYYDEVVEFVKLLFTIETPTARPGFITIMPERMASSSIQASVDGFRQMKKTKKLFVGDMSEDDEYESAPVELIEKALKKLDSVIEKGELVGDKDTKLQELEKVIKELEASGVKRMIIFSFFRRTIDYLHLKLCDSGLKASKMHGLNTPNERYEIVDRFRRGEFDILISSEVGSEGLDMQFCNVVVNYDMPWNPMRVEQRIGRIDRIGQKADKLLIFNLCLEGSIEDRIYRRLYDKLGIFENSIGELEPILGEMSDKFDMQKILSMSEEETKKLVDINEFAAHKILKDAKIQSEKIDTLLNNDYLAARQDDYLDKTKEEFFRKECKTLVVEFFDKSGIVYSDKSDGMKISEKDLGALSDRLQHCLPDRNSARYTKERGSIRKIVSGKINKFSFFESSSDMHTENITLSHPLIAMLARKKSKSGEVKTVVKHPERNCGYMFLYSFNIKGFKDNMQLVGFTDDGTVELNPLLVIASCEKADDIGAFDIDVNHAYQFMTQYQNELKKAEQLKNDKYIDGVVGSLNAHYNKKIEQADKRADDQNEKIRGMKGAESANLTNELWGRIEKIEKGRRISISSELIGILKFV